MRALQILVCSFCIAVAAQEPAPQPAPDKPAPAEANSPEFERLRAADEAGRPKALADFVDAKIATQAVFSGQYAALKQLDWDTGPLLRGWLKKVPAQIKSEPLAFQVACINALRDCVEKAPEDLITQLQELATGLASPMQLASSAKFALAQFGKPELADQMIQAAMKGTEETNIGARVGAWSQLADIYYNLRRYEDAAKAHQKVITAIESVRPDFPNLPSSYYNCACSLALSGKKEEALTFLSKGLALGKKLNRQLGKEMLDSDMDISSLRGTAEFTKLLEEYYAPAKKPATDAKDGGGQRPDKQGSGG